MPATVADAHDLLLASVRDPNPVVFIENRRLYGMRGDARRRTRCRSARPASRAPARTSRSSPGGRCCATASPRPRQATLSLEVIDLRSLVPLDMDTVLASVRKTGRLLIVHEAVQDFGAGAEIAARVADELFDELLAPVRRLGAPSVPMPFSPDLETGAAARLRGDRRRPPRPSGPRDQ